MEDQIEKKAVDLLIHAISADCTGYAPEARGIAEAIEAELMKEYGTSDSREFRSRVRSIVFNLKDPKNVALREGLINGTVSPTAFSHMDVRELANPEMQEERHKLEEKVLEETIIHKVTPGEDDHVKKVEFLTYVGRLDQHEQATNPPPDEHQQMLQSK